MIAFSDSVVDHTPTIALLADQVKSTRGLSGFGDNRDTITGLGASLPDLHVQTNVETCTCWDFAEFTDLADFADECRLHSC